MKSTKAAAAALLIMLTILHPAVSASTLPDNHPPTAPKGLAAANITHTTISLSWTGSNDNTGVKGYQVYRDGKKIASTVKTSYMSKALIPGRKYAYSIRAYDAAGNVSESSSELLAETLSDTQSPSSPTGLTVSSITETEANLIWLPASDNVKVGSYDILRDGVKTGTTSKTSYHNKNLIPGKSYTYTVRASDISGNVSGTGCTLTVTTLTDKKAPSAPAGLKVTAVNGTSVSLSWTASTDNSKVAGYQIYCNGIVISTAARNTRTVKNPFGSDSDVFWVKAYDQSGNLSDSSNTVTAAAASK